MFRFLLLFPLLLLTFSAVLHPLMHGDHHAGNAEYSATVHASECPVCSGIFLFDIPENEIEHSTPEFFGTAEAIYRAPECGQIINRLQTRGPPGAVPVRA